MVTMDYKMDIRSLSEECGTTLTQERLVHLLHRLLIVTVNVMNQKQEKIVMISLTGEPNCIKICQMVLRYRVFRF